MERRLAAILAADVVGYSRLIEANEAGTLAALKSHREALIEPKIDQYHGRIVKLMGDGLLAEFPSAVEAVAFAVETQSLMGERNEAVPEDRRIVFRIGINIGDVIIEGGDIHGDGVNIAARLEVLSEPGGICISRPVHTQIKRKLDLTYEAQGGQKLKNISEVVEVYRVTIDDKAAALVTPVARPVAKPRPQKMPLAIALAVATSLIVGITLWWRPWVPDFEPAAPERMAFPLPDKPSIAVLPFDNMSADAEQGYFADGITEDLITDLSRISGLFVIARNSSFSFKGQQVKVQEVAEKLGVRYVLEGSVRRAGDQVRINAQLVDCQTGAHLWADRFDGHMTDVFVLQDRVTASIVSALALTLTVSESDRLAMRETTDPAAYDAYLEGLTHYRAFTQDDFAKAETYLLRAIEIDPNYAQAHAALAAVYWYSILRAWRGPLGWGDARDRVRRHLERVRDNPPPLALRIQSRMLLHEGRHDEALATIKRAIGLDPNDAENFSQLGYNLIFAGEPEEGMAALHKAMRLDPAYPALVLQRLGYAYFGMEQYQEAVTMFERAHQRNPGLNAWMLIAAYGHLNQIDVAQQTLASYLEYRGWGTWRQVKHILPYFPYRNPSDQERFARGMVKGGMCCPDQIARPANSLSDLQQ